MRTEEHFVQVGDDLIYYIHGGAPRTAGDAPLVFVHGMSGGTAWWTKNLPALGEHSEFYALDLPGFGRSRTLRKQFEIENAITALAGWLSAVKVSRAVFVGHSLGGYVIAALAARSPDLAGGLVLIDPAIFPPNYSRWRLAFGLLRAPFHLSPSFVPTLLKGAFAAGLATILAAARDLLTRPILRELPAIQARTLLIWGDKDTLVPVSLSEIVLAAMSGRATGPILLRGGHASMWDDADKFNQAVGQFLTELGARR